METDAADTVEVIAQIPLMFRIIREIREVSNEVLRVSRRPLSAFVTVVEAA